MDNLTQTEKEFYKACEKGDLEKVKTLIKQGVNINRQNFRSYNSTALMEACLYNQKEVVKELLKNGADVKIQSALGGALSYSCGHNSDKEIVEILLKAGANPNEKDYFEYDQTVFIYSCRCGRLDIAKILFKAGADINACSTLGHNALGKVISNYFYGTGHLHYKKVYPPIIRWLIRNGADVNHYDGTDSILTLACDAYNGYGLEIIELLLKSGADISRKNEQNKTALDIAREKGHTNLIGVLEKYRNL